MQNRFTPPETPSTDGTAPPEAPRRLLNERIYRDRVDDLPEAPVMASKKKMLRFQETMPQILVNDVGMIRGCGCMSERL